jgi:hypothetical protein
MHPFECLKRGEWILRIISFAITLTIVSTGILLVEPAQAGGVVTSCTESSLRAAMAGGGTVTFACDGSITLGSTLTNETDIVFDGSGHQVTISGGNVVRVFFLGPHITLSLVNLTIAKGTAVGGAGILNSGGTVNATNCTFSENLVSGGYGGGGSRGGAIYNNGTVILDFCMFTGNWSSGAPGTWQPGTTLGGSGSGGAIFNNGTLEVRGSAFLGNGANGAVAGPGGMPGAPGGDGSGGAIYNQGNLWLDSSTLENNGATGGAGGTGADGHPWMDIATDGGTGGTGGLGAGGGLFNSGTATAVNTTFAGNFGGGGPGGTGGTGGTGQLIGGNGGSGGTGGAGFGAIYDSSGLLYLTNCTLALNGGSGGAAGAGGMGGGHLSLSSGLSGASGLSGTSGVGSGGIKSIGCPLVNTILATNSGNCFGWVTDGGHNLSSDGTCAFTGVGSMNNTDPKLGPLANNGGPTLTMALLPGSPAINAGDPAGAPPTDQRGVTRPQGPGVDMGAFEYQYVPVFTGAKFQNSTNFWLQLSGMLPAQAFKLQGSTNLMDWFDLTNFVAGANGVCEFVDGNLGKCATRFYRLKVSSP